VSDTPAGLPATAAAPSNRNGDAPDHIAIDLDSLTTGDLEDMEDYCGQPVLSSLQEASAAMADGGPAALVGALPTRMLTALLGVTKRWKDPEFGPDKWRSIKLSELFVVDDSVDAQAPPPPGRGPNRAARRSKPPKPSQKLKSGPTTNGTG
jgi:hypothetical protein